MLEFWALLLLVCACSCGLSAAASCGVTPSVPLDPLDLLLLAYVSGPMLLWLRELLLPGYGSGGPLDPLVYMCVVGPPSLWLGGVLLPGLGSGGSLDPLMLVWLGALLPVLRCWLPSGLGYGGSREPLFVCCWV